MSEEPARDDHARADGRAAGDGSTVPDGVNPDPNDPFADGVSRRRLLRSSAAAGATAAVAGCTGDADDGGSDAPTLFTFNNGDRTVSVVDAETDELVDTVFVDTTASFPANQYGTALDSDYHVLWLNVAGGVRALDARTLDELAYVETGFGGNYPNLTPDGDHLVIGAGGSLGLDPDGDEDHRILRVDADPDSDAFGEVTGDLSVGYTGPCDATLTPDGEYALVPDVANDTISVVRVDPFEVVERVDAGEPAEEGNVLPFMATASWDGEFMLVENGEGRLGDDGETRGSESIWDISDPTSPEEVARITRDDGLPGLPITSEIAPDGETAYLFTPAADGLVVVDVPSAEVTGTIDLGGSTIGGAWGPNREKLYAPVQTANEVAVVDHEAGEVAARVETGEAPTGAVAAGVRPETDATNSLRADLAALGLPMGDMEWTYCPDGHCYCGR